MDTYQQNGDETSLWPTCDGFDGVIKAYISSLETYDLHAPTDFAPIIKFVRRYM